MFFFSTFQMFSQEEIHSFVQQKAAPKEGIKAFYENFIQEFNADDAPEGIEEVNLRLKFVVEKDGSFSNIEILKDTVGLGAEAVRVLKTMPAWNPAKNKGKVVRSSFVIPMKVLINDPKKQSERILFATPEAVQAFQESLNESLVETPYFDLTCDCSLVRSSINDEARTEEFSLQSEDDKVYYNLVFRKVSPEQATAELNAIETDAANQNATINTIELNGQTATEIFFDAPNGDYVNHYRTIFLAQNGYVVGISLVSNNKQLSDLTIAHLKKNFKLKI